MNRIWDYVVYDLTSILQALVCIKKYSNIVFDFPQIH